MDLFIQQVINGIERPPRRRRTRAGAREPSARRR
jgi:hypothetical protein